MLARPFTNLQDDEDEMCTIASTWELQEAVVLAQTLNRPNLKLFVTSKPALLEPVVVEMKKPAVELDLIRRGRAQFAIALRYVSHDAYLQPWSIFFRQAVKRSNEQT